MDWEPIAEVALPPVGADWHRLRLDFLGSRIRVHYDGDQVIEEVSDLYASGGVSMLTWTGSVPAEGYGAAFDDISVRARDEYGGRGTLLSSAFDGGVGAQWGTVSWKAATGNGTAARVRTRTSDRADHLSASTWSNWYTTSGSPVAGTHSRWIQYELELTSSTAMAPPLLHDIAITYEVAEAGPFVAFVPRLSR
jgi:hypothetical protein